MVEIKRYKSTHYMIYITLHWTNLYIFGIFSEDECKIKPCISHKIKYNYSFKVVPQFRHFTPNRNNFSLNISIFLSAWGTTFYHPSSTYVGVKAFISHHATGCPFWFYCHGNRTSTKRLVQSGNFDFYFSSQWKLRLHVSISVYR